MEILDGSSKAAKEADLSGQPPIELVGNTTQQLTQPKYIAKKAESYQNVEVREFILLAIKVAKSEASLKVMSPRFWE